MRERINNFATWVLVLIVVPLGLGWAALLYINNLLKYKQPK
jgi:hypothetical protein